MSLSTKLCNNFSSVVLSVHISGHGGDEIVENKQNWSCLCCCHAWENRTFLVWLLSPNPSFVQRVVTKKYFKWIRFN